MKKFFAIAVFIFGVVPNVYAEAGASLSKPLPLEIGGRVKIEKTADGQKAYVYSWPGIYFVGKFIGTEVEARLNDDQNYLAVIVDDQAPVVLKKPGKMSYKIKDLKPGHHQIRIEKITETQSSVGRFEGFFVARDAKVESPKSPKRAIEFIGDSHTVGYGNTSSTRDCDGEQVYQTTNTSHAFGPLTAKHFNAAYQINAFSGFGVVRNYNGTSADKSLLSIYPFALNNGAAIATDNWHPKVIVIGLGTNDFSTPLNPSERWKTRDELQKDYVSRYLEFARALHAKSPHAYFILLSSDGMNGEYSQQVDLVAEQLKSDKSLRVARLVYKGLEYTSCHWHPSEKDDQAMAKLIIDHLEQQKGIW